MATRDLRDNRTQQQRALLLAQLRADIQQGIDEDERGEGIDADEIWRVYGLVDDAGNRIVRKHSASQ